jgi:hypothetical protein
MDFRTNLNFLLLLLWIDIALEILKKDPNLARTAVHRKSYLLFFDYIEKRGPACGWTALKELARKPFAIGSKSQLSSWKRLLNSC